MEKLNRGYVLLNGQGAISLARKMNEIIKALNEIKADFNGHTHTSAAAGNQTQGPTGRSMDYAVVEELMP